jgi:hypothetical protein
MWNDPFHCCIFPEEQKVGLHLLLVLVHIVSFVNLEAILIALKFPMWLPVLEFKTSSFVQLIYDWIQWEGFLHLMMKNT